MESDFIRLKENSQGFEYIEAIVKVKIRMYTDQEDLTPTIRKSSAIERIKKHLKYRLHDEFDQSTIEIEIL